MRIAYILSGATTTPLEAESKTLAAGPGYTKVFKATTATVHRQYHDSKISQYYVDVLCVRESAPKLTYMVSF